VLIIVFFAIFCDKAERDVFIFGKQAFQFFYMAETARLTQLSE